MAAGTRMAKAAPPNISPSENFAGLEGSSRLRLSASHNQAKTGASATTKTGCTNWYQLAGKTRPKGRVRSVLRSANRLSVEPACSKDAQKRAEATNSTRMAADRLRSSGDHPSESSSQENTTTEMPSSAQPT